MTLDESFSSSTIYDEIYDTVPKEIDDRTPLAALPPPPSLPSLPYPPSQQFPPLNSDGQRIQQLHSSGSVFSKLYSATLWSQFKTEFILKKINSIIYSTEPTNLVVNFIEV